MEYEVSGDEADKFFKKIGKKLIAIAIFGFIFPIALIVYFIKYLKKKDQHKYDLQYLQEYESIISIK